MENSNVNLEVQQEPVLQEPQQQAGPPQKFCKHCGEVIDADCIVCPKCGKQVETLQQSQQPQPQVVINNSNTSTNTNTNINRNTGFGGAYPYKSKIVALLLCIFLGYLGVHRFYVGKVGTGIVWLLTLGLCGIGWVVDIVTILLGGFRDKANMPLK